MGFVIDKQGNYLPVFGESVGGSPEGYLPADTIIKVELDGSGDFTKLSDAFNYLTGKWSNGTVTIQLGEGTFEETSTISLRGDSYNIPHITLSGVSSSETIVQFDTTAAAIDIVNTSASVSNLTLKKLSKSGVCVQNQVCSWASFADIIIDNFVTALSSISLGNLHLATNISIKNCTTGVRSERGSGVCTNVGSIISFDNVNTAWYVTTGGMITTSMPVSNITYTSVATKCSQTVGTFTSNGYIGGTLQN